MRAYPYSSTQGAQRLYFDQIKLPQVARATSADVLFSTTGFGTWQKPCPEVLLMRNTAYFDPQFHAQYRKLGRSLMKNTLRRWHSLVSARQATAILFPTQAMHDLVAQYVDLPDKQTHAMHYGFDRSRFFQDDPPEPEIAQRMRRWTAAGDPVLLSVSTYAVHKNFETLIEALPHLQERMPGVKLVTTTSRARTSDKQEYDALQQRARDLGVTDCWIESGYVDYTQLQHLYRAADAYVFPSFTESFGHSMVEAMAAELPVIAAGTAVNREVCGSAGRFFAPFDAAACGEAIASVLTDPQHQQRLRGQARARIGHFSWEAYTRKLVNVFRSVARRPVGTSLP